MTRESMIYERLEAAGQPAQLPGWPTSQNFVRLPGDSRALLEMLRSEFNDDDLTAAGVLTCDGQLAPALCDDGSGGPLGMALRQQVEAPPLAYLAGMQLLAAPDLPIVAMLEDYRIKARLHDSPYGAQVVCSAEDLLSLDSLGLPTVPVTGLATLGDENLELLFRQLAVHGTGAADRGPDDSDITSAPMTLVNWSPARLGLIDSSIVEQVEAHLWELNDFLTIALDEVLVWQPSDYTLQRFELARRHAPRRLAELILKNLDEDTGRIEEPFEAPADLREPPPPTYKVLLGRWMVQSDSEEAARKALWHDLQQRIQTELLDPLLTQAEQERDPVRKNMLANLAALEREFHTRSAARAAHHCDHKQGMGSRSDDDTNTLLQLERRIAELSQRLNPGEKSRMSRSETYSGPAIAPVDLLSALAKKKQ